MKKVFTNGCFDVMHLMHVELLRFAKLQGDYLVVGLNSDESVKRLKGDTRPIFNQEDRKKFLESIRYVDKVIIFNEDTPLDLIKEVRPDLIVKGGDYKAEDVVGAEICPVKIFPFTSGYSTTSILQALN